MKKSTTTDNDYNDPNKLNVSVFRPLIKDKPIKKNGIQTKIRINKFLFGHLNTKHYTEEHAWFKHRNEPDKIKIDKPIKQYNENFLPKRNKDNSQGDFFWRNKQTREHGKTTGSI